MHIYSLSTKNSLQAMESHGILHHTYIKRGWSGNTIPVAWSTFWV